MTATATETSLAKKEEDLKMRQTLRLGLEERSAAKLVERAKWIGGGVVRNLIELSLIVITRQNEELSLGRDGVVGRKEWRAVKSLFMSGANLLEYMATRSSGDNNTSNEEKGASNGGALIERQLDIAERFDFMARQGKYFKSDAGAM